MCLHVDKKCTKKARTTRKKDGYVYRYKMVSVALTNAGEVELEAVYRDHKYMPGINVAAGIDKAPSLGKLPRQIHASIHVFTKPRNDDSDLGHYCIKVKCFNKDLVACNRGSEEAYLRVTLDQKEHDRLCWKLAQRWLRNIKADTRVRNFLKSATPIAGTAAVPYTPTRTRYYQKAA